MAAGGFADAPSKASYDVVIVGGAIMGSSTAFFLADNPDFNGSVLVIERDVSYAACSTAHTNSCVRQQFSQALNIRISQFTVEFIRDMRARMGGDPRIPNLDVQNFGYLYLADTPEFADQLRAVQKVQVTNGAETRLIEPAALAAQFPFYNVDDLILASHNTKDEGYWEGGTVFDWFRRTARARGVEYVSGEVVGLGMDASGQRVESVTLASGEVISCGHLVNATGPRAARLAAMAGIALPVEPRKRFTWVFKAENPLPVDLPLTIDPSGIHMRQDGPTTYMAGCKPDPDPAVDPQDFSMDHQIWQDFVWPTVATRIPQFEAIRVVNEWAGHYAFNTLDQNAVLGPHPVVANFLFINGFSGHGLQQSPAMGRGLAEWIAHGEYRSLDMSPFSYARIMNNQPIIERAVI